MKTLILIIFLVCNIHAVDSQSLSITLFNGASTFSSDFPGRYSPGYSIGLSSGILKMNGKFGYNVNLGVFSNSAEIEEIQEYVRYSTLRLYAGPVVKIKNKCLLSANLSAGKFLTEYVRIKSPQYNYDFDKVEFSMMFEISTSIYENKAGSLNIGFSFFRNVDGIIDNNFWQKDNLRATNLFAVMGFVFKSQP